MTDNSALFQLGMDLEAPGTTREEEFATDNVVPFNREEHEEQEPKQAGNVAGPPYLSRDLLRRDGHSG